MKRTCRLSSSFAECVFTYNSPDKHLGGITFGAHEMAKHVGSFDFILDTVSADPDVNTYIQLLGLDGNLTLVVVPENPLLVSSFALLIGRKSLSGSVSGGIAETQEMLDFGGEHGITSGVEIIPIQKINEAYP